MATKKKPPDERTIIKAADIQVGDVIRFRENAAGTVDSVEPHDDVLHIWWRSEDDPPDLPPHRMAPRSADEDVTLLRRAGETDA